MPLRYTTIYTSHLLTKLSYQDSTKSLTVLRVFLVSLTRILIRIVTSTSAFCALITLIKLGYTGCNFTLTRTTMKPLTRGDQQKYKTLTSKAKAEDVCYLVARIVEVTFKNKKNSTVANYLSIYLNSAAVDRIRTDDLRKRRNGKRCSG